MVLVSDSVRGRSIGVMEKGQLGSKNCRWCDGRPIWGRGRSHGASVSIATGTAGPPLGIPLPWHTVWQRAQEQCVGSRYGERQRRCRFSISIRSTSAMS